MLRSSDAMSQILDRVLSAARQLGASDVHLKAGLPPIFRIKGELRTVRDVPALTREAIAGFAAHMMSDKQRAAFEDALDLDLAYGTPDGVRYRANVFQQRGSVGMVLRLIPPEVPPFDHPNPIGLVELEEGTRLVAQLVGVKRDEIRIGQAVQVEFASFNDGELVLPQFRPVRA